MKSAAFYPATPNNVVQGRLTSPMQMDWAVLCSRKGVSSILVYRRGMPGDVAELAGARDEAFLQASGRSIMFARLIGVANADFIHVMNAAYGGGPLPSVDHHGINDAFLEKASTLRYWHNRKHDLQGAD